MATGRCTIHPNCDKSFEMWRDITGQDKFIYVDILRFSFYHFRSRNDKMLGSFLFQSNNKCIYYTLIS